MTLKAKYPFVLLCSLILFTCSSDDDNNNDTGNPELAIDLVTGLIAKQGQNDPGFLLGNPNIRMPQNFTSTSIIAYPNPINTVFNISLIQTNEVITDVWLVRATAEKIFENTNFDIILTEDTYSVDEISQAAIESYSGFTSNDIFIDVDGFEQGYYRVFIKTDQSLYWDNLYIANNGVDITDFFDSWN